MNTIVSRLKAHAQKRSAYWRTVREIQNMPIEEANDLGIARADAHRIASESVYG